MKKNTGNRLVSTHSLLYKIDIITKNNFYR